MYKDGKRKIEKEVKKERSREINKCRQQHILIEIERGRERRGSRDRETKRKGDTEIDRYRYR